MITKLCPNCKNEFHTYKSIDKKCCSRECSDEFRKKKTFEKRKKECLTCHRWFLPKHTTATKGLYCCYACFGKSNIKESVNRGGYKHKQEPGHPRATKQGYVAIHVLVMEKYLLRYLSEDEIVHHVDENKSNNNIDNLELMTDSSHKSHHAKRVLRNNLSQFCKLEV